MRQTSALAVHRRGQSPAGCAHSGQYSRVGSALGSSVATAVRGLPIALLSIIGAVFLISTAFALMKDLPLSGGTCTYEEDLGSGSPTHLGQEAVVWGLVPEVECRYTRVTPSGSEVLARRSPAVAGPLLGVPVGLIAGGAAFAVASKRRATRSAMNPTVARQHRA